MRVEENRISVVVTRHGIGGLSHPHWLKVTWCAAWLSTCCNVSQQLRQRRTQGDWRALKVPLGRVGGNREETGRKPGGNREETGRKPGGNREETGRKDRGEGGRRSHLLHLSRLTSSLQMAILVSGHLSESQDGIGALEAVVVRLFVRVGAAVHPAALRRCELFEAGRQDRVGLLMLAPVGHHFVRVGADELAFQTVEVRRFILHRACWVWIFFHHVHIQTGSSDSSFDCDNYPDWRCRGSRISRTIRWLCTAGNRLPSTCPASRAEPCAAHTKSIQWNRSNCSMLPIEGSYWMGCSNRSQMASRPACSMAPWSSTTRCVFFLFWLFCFSIYNYIRCLNFSLTSNIFVVERK